jgi:hypothetical protein
VLRSHLLHSFSTSKKDARGIQQSEISKGIARRIREVVEFVWRVDRKWPEENWSPRANLFSALIVTSEELVRRCQ